MTGDDQPLAYFITWTVYGTFLPGDPRGWRKRRAGSQIAQPLLDHWHRERLKHEVLLLSDQHRVVTKQAIAEICEFRGWRRWADNPRSNHVHLVVTAPGYAGNIVRDQTKAKCTRMLRVMDEGFRDRPVWSRGGDWQCINKDEELELAIQYVEEAQDRMMYER